MSEEEGWPNLLCHQSVEVVVDTLNVYLFILDGRDSKGYRPPLHLPLSRILLEARSLIKRPDR
jgi:hypothetical protein